MSKKRPLSVVDRAKEPVSAFYIRLCRDAATWLSGAADWCARQAKTKSAASPAKKSLPTNIPWRTLMIQLGSRAAVRAIVGCGAIGNDFPREGGAPAGRRILVLAAHQDDEGIGAGGTFLLAAGAGAKFRVVYTTDGATAYGSFSEEQTSEFRKTEASRVWRRIAGVRPIFWDYPNRSPIVAEDAGQRLSDLIADFKPDTIFLPSFIEQPLEHRRLNDILLAADAIRPLDGKVEVWGYQITTRAPGSRVVDVTHVARAKRDINKLWRSQNAYLDYAHLAEGRDIAASYYLKGVKVKPRRGHAETFLTFRAPEYLRLARTFCGLPEAPEPGVFNGRRVPSPDFFVIGMQKSGSYWLTALLDSHPMVRCFPSRPGLADGTGEAHLFDVLARMDHDFKGFSRSLRAKLDGLFADLVPKQPLAGEEERRQFLQAVRARFDEFCHEQRLRYGKPLVGEKTTETVHHPELVQALYPGVRKICILRDPRDRCVSFFFHQIRKGRVAEDAWLDDAFVDSYAERVRQDYAGLLAMEGPLHLMTYEGLKADTAQEVRRLVAFLRLPDDAEAVTTMIEGGSFERLSGRASGAEETHSHYRKGVVGDWQERLAPQQAERLVAAVEDLTAQVEARFGVSLAAYRRAATGAAAKA